MSTPTEPATPLKTPTVKQTVPNTSVTTESSNVKISFPVDIPCQQFLGEVTLDHFFNYAGLGQLQTKRVTIKVSPELREHVHVQLEKTFTYWNRLSKERRDQICNSEALWAIIKKLHDEVEINHAIIFATNVGLGLAGSGVKQQILANRRAAEGGKSWLKQKNATSGSSTSDPLLWGQAFNYNAFNVYLPDPASQTVPFPAPESVTSNQGGAVTDTVVTTTATAKSAIVTEDVPNLKVVSKPTDDEKESAALDCRQNIVYSPASPDEAPLVIDEDTV